MTDEEAKKMIEGMSEWDARNLLNKKGYGPASIKMLLKAEKEAPKPVPKPAPKAAPIDKVKVQNTKIETPVQQAPKRKASTEAKK
jgi:hypothetical protein